MTSEERNTQSRGFFSRFWKAIWSPTSKYSLGALLAGGIVLGVGGWGAFNWSMELTNTETFCITCHEMRDFVFEEYKETIHYNNRTGVRATCPDCHVPKEWIYKVRRKIQASNELYHKALGSIDTQEKFEEKRLQLAKNVWKAMKETDSRECRNCHSYEFMDMTKQERRSQKRHAKGQKKGETCIDCHKGIAHELPEGWDEEEES